MKQDANQPSKMQMQKYFLSALLFAALGSNYYFQTNSKDNGHIELASAVDDLSNAADAAKTEKAVAHKAVEAKAASIACTDCIQISKLEYQNLKTLADKITAAEALKEKESVKAKETPQEKRIREREEKLEKAKAKKEKEDEKKEAIKQKLNDEKEARNEDFKDKMEEAAASCKGDVECSSGKLVSLLNEYTDKNKIDSTVVNAAFNQYIAKDLKVALRDPQAASLILESLHQINADLPVEYRNLKEKTVDILKNDAMLKSVEINRNYKLADMLTKAKRPTEAYEYLMNAKQQGDLLTYSSNMIYNSTIQGLQESHDLTTMDYIKRLYLPDMNKILSNLSNLNSLDTVLGTSTTSTSTTLNQPNQGSQNTRGNSRSESASITTEQKTNVNQQNDSSNVLNGVQFGSKTARPRLNRGAVQ